MQNLSSMLRSPCFPCHFPTPMRDRHRFPGTWIFPTHSYFPAKNKLSPKQLMAPLSTEKYTMRKTGTLVSLTGRKQIQVDDWGTCHVSVPWQGNNSCKSTSRWEYTMLLSGAGWRCAAWGWREHSKLPKPERLRVWQWSVYSASTLFFRGYLCLVPGYLNNVKCFFWYLIFIMMSW